jgi:hypothetical protein
MNPLEKLVLHWAKGNEDDFIYWMNELDESKIRDIENLQQAASTMSFNLSPMLKAKIEIWCKGLKRSFYENRAT